MHSSGARILHVSSVPHHTSDQAENALTGESTSMNATQLGRSPVELRLHIYEEALTFKERIRVQLWTGTPQYIGKATHILACSQVCKQMRRESTPILSDINVVILVAAPPDTRF